MQSYSYTNNQAPISDNKKLTKNYNHHDFQNFDMGSWYNNPGSSVFIKRIPDWLDKEMIVSLFDSADTENNQNDIAKVSRVHIVDVSPTKGTGRMAFVHFVGWYNVSESHRFRQGIMECDNFVKVIYNPRNGGDKYYLNITANRRPIPCTTYDNDQLSDMINTANNTITMLSVTLTEMQQLVSSQSTRIGQLESMMQSSTSVFADGLDYVSPRARLLGALSRKDLIESSPSEWNPENFAPDVRDITKKYAGLAQQVIDDLCSGKIVDSVVSSTRMGKLINSPQYVPNDDMYC